MAARASDLQGGALLERDQEVAVIRAALEKARDGAGIPVVIEGPGGIGKTALLEAARRLANERGMGVAIARGSEFERELAFGVVRQLLEPVVLRADNVARVELLSGAAELAAPLFDPPSDSGAERGAEQQFSVLHGLYWLCANVAQSQPLLLAVDDAHWADRDSLRFVAYLANRLEGLPLALVIAARPAETPTEEAVLGRLATDPRTVRVGPAPLSFAAVAKLLAGGLGMDPDAAFVTACHAATGGTPFLVHELVREVKARGLAPVAESVGEVAELGPRAIARAVVARARRVGGGALEAARAVAVLGADAQPHRVARLAQLDASSLPAVLDGLAAADVLQPGQSIVFAHPIVRSAVYGELPRGERGRLHVLAAHVLVEEGAPAERIAAHVLATDPSGDPNAVQLLLRTARTAFGRGAPSSAGAYLSRALAEPPSGAVLVDVLHQLGRAEIAQGTATFVRTLRRAIDVCASAERRARIALDLGGALAHAGDMSAAVATFEQALNGLPDRDSPLAMRVEGELLPVALYHYPSRDAVAGRLAVRLAELEAGDLDDPTLLAALGRWSAECRPPARRGAEMVESAENTDLEVGTWVPGGVGGALVYSGVLGRAAEYLERQLGYARSRGWRLSTAWGETWQAAVSLLRGDVTRGEAGARLALDTMRDPTVGRTHTALVWACAVLIEALLARGAVEEAAAVLADAGAAEEHPPTYWRSLLIAARGRLRLAQGDAEGALADALASAPPYGEGLNPAVRPWRSDAAWALRALGRPKEGVEHASAELRDARDFDVPHAIGAALRSLAACSPGDAAVPVLREAVDVLEGSEARLELARALVDLGAALRRMKRRSECREPLRRGLDLAHRCAAHAAAERARTELQATGARPRRAVLSGVEALTASERRVAELASGGMTNREIAQTLFVTQRTVETHLTQAFRKLDISSRGELAASLAAGHDD